MRNAATTGLLLVLGYLALAALLTWPLVLHLDDHLLGTAAMDQVDTAWLRLAAARWLTGQEPGIFAPLGYPLPAVIPNWIDHILGAPLALLLPWPLADNLWWLLVLAANGLAAHLLGFQLGKSHGAGLLCGVAFACCEPVLREAGLSHAPQALLCWAPLFLAFLLRALGERGRPRQGALAGLFLALAALTYWYQGLFLAVLAAPAVLVALWRAGQDRGALLGRLALGGAVALALCAGPLLLVLWAAPDLAGGGTSFIPGQQALGVPPRHAWAFLHGSGPGWPFLAQPADTSNRLSLVLLAAAIWAAWRSPRTSWPWWLAALAGGLLLMGPFLQVADEPLRLGRWLIPLPGYLLAEASGAMARLHWPLRWGMIVPLALLPLAARVPRPTLFAGALLLETLLASANAPLPSRDVAAFDGWRALATAPGPVLVLPQELRGDGPASMGLIFRASKAPLANELGIPPRAFQPMAFRQWKEGLKIHGWWHRLRRSGRDLPLPEGAWQELADQGGAPRALAAPAGGG